MGTRLDITFAVQVLSQFASKLPKEHWRAIKRVLCYLQGTRDLGIMYNDSSRFIDIHVNGYSDADWASSTIDRQSVSGYVFLLGGGAVAWSSKKQLTVALSSTEAKYMVSSNATTQAM